MPTLLRDVRLAIREFSRHPVFTAAAVITLALGIGATTAIFSVVNTVLLRPIPYDAPEQLVVAWQTVPAEGETEGLVSYPDFRDWRERTESFEDLSAFMAFANGNVNLTGGTEPQRVAVARVMAGYFELLGVAPLLGRAIRPEENVVGSHRVAVLSHGLWQRQFGGDTSLVGGSVFVNGFAYTVVGIMPAEFRPVGALALGTNVELWRPLAPDDNQTGGRGARQLRVIGRLKHDVTVAEAQADLSRIARDLALEYPNSNEGTGVRLLPLREQVVQNVRPALLLLFGAVGLVLVIAGTNVANLLLARAAPRRRPIAIRMALGAPRRRIVQQLITESLLLGGLGGGVGIGVAIVGTSVLRALGPEDIPMLGDVRMDVAVLLFAAGTSLLSGIVFGLAPGLRLTKSDLTQDLKEGGRSVAGSAERRIASALVISQVAIALVLTVAAGLLMRSFRELMLVDPGYDPRNVITMQLELPMATTYPRQEMRGQFFDQLLERIEALPGVERASMANAPPMGEGGFEVGYSVEGLDDPASRELLRADLRLVDPAYFETMKIPVLSGRAFADADDGQSPAVAIVNETLMRRIAGSRSPLASRLTLSFGPDAEVIGVVGDVRSAALDQDINPIIYWPAAQLTYNFMTVMARTSTDPAGSVSAIRREIRAMDPDLPVYNLATLEELIGASAAQRRFQMILVGSFSWLAVLLALVGIYGVIDYSVSQRTHELGLRMALGARSVDAVRVVLLQGARLTGVGVAIGVVVSLVLNRVLASFLFSVKSVDPVTYVLTVVLLGSVALTAVYVPARRAAAVDPLIALRRD